MGGNLNINVDFLYVVFICRYIYICIYIVIKKYKIIYVSIYVSDCWYDVIIK